MTRKKLLMGAALGAPLVAALGIGLNEPASEVVKPAGAVAATDAETPAPRPGLAQSSDKVRLAITDGSGPEPMASDSIVVTLDMESGWHVNANPATMDFLIPTVVTATVDGEPLAVRTQYPPGRVSDITLGETAIEVYDDGVGIRLLPDEESLARLKQSGSINVQARVQACNDSGVCLAPSDLSATLAVPADGH